MISRLLAVTGAALLALMLSACTGTAASGVTIALNPSPVGTQLHEQLPSKLLFEDRMGAADVATLPTPLAVDDATTVTKYRRGDVGYRAAGQELYIFHNGGTAVHVDGLVLVGRITDGLEDLEACPRSCSVRMIVSDVTDGDDQ